MEDTREVRGLLEGPAPMCPDKSPPQPTIIAGTWRFTPICGVHARPDRVSVCHSERLAQADDTRLGRNEPYLSVQAPAEHGYLGHTDGFCPRKPRPVRPSGQRRRQHDGADALVPVDVGNFGQLLCFAPGVLSTMTKITTTSLTIVVATVTVTVTVTAVSVLVFVSPTTRRLVHFRGLMTRSPSAPALRLRRGFPRLHAERIV